MWLVAKSYSLLSSKDASFLTINQPWQMKTYFRRPVFIGSTVDVSIWKKDSKDSKESWFLVQSPPDSKLSICGKIENLK
jgi:hypothetical protein